MTTPRIICMTSVRNDAWILRQFLEAAQTWAELIIVGDHCSTDDSSQIARQFVTVRLIAHQSASSFLDRRRDLLAEARKVPGQRLIFLLDVDEMITANWANSPDWDLMLRAQPGSRFSLNWLELYPGLSQTAVFWMPSVFMDDGTEYPLGERIHGSRFPGTSDDIIKLYDIKLLHYNLIDTERLLSKHRYYKCYEFIELKRRPWALDVYYQDTTFKSYGAPVVPVNEEWLRGYDWLAEYRSIDQRAERQYWYDQEVLRYFDQYGVAKFRKLNIWDVDWTRKAEMLGMKGSYRDPRSGYEIWIHRLIEKHREGLKMKPSLTYRLVRLFARTVLRAVGW